MMTKSYGKGNTNAMYRKKGKPFNRKINTENVTALMEYYKKGKLNAFLLYFVKIFIFTLLIWIYQCDNSKGIIQQCCAKFDKVNTVYIRPNRFLGENLKYEQQRKETTQQELFSKKDEIYQDAKFKVDTRAHTDKMDSKDESKSCDKSQESLALENKNSSPRKSILFKICKETFLLK
ncbi:hypothetical protein POCGH01_00062400 [Plasmodium ovale]|uniref:Uncharacterized protein n=1 Tax=Plasmodium ovale TaxID=36330 RepID=A0A1D3JGF1_PLAOA|nr:hypothetical protein POCGH01_00062400 [Plasmodium ovale]